ncbi:MAG: translation elongation factor Ts [Candidatus Sumerlaeota bacterium]
MAEITAQMVKTLREQTGVGMMECKKALQEAEGDLERAGNILREKGAAKAVKRAGRATKEGLIQAQLSADKKNGAMVEVNIETDFAARSERFGIMVDMICKAALENQTEDAEALKNAEVDGKKIETEMKDAQAAIGENMGINRVATSSVEADGLIHTYIHPPGKVGVMLTLKTESPEVADNQATDDLAHEICLQIAFSNPVSIDTSSIPEDVVNAEKEVYRKTAINEGKPEKIIDKIVEGKMKAFYKEHCLLYQAYVKEEKQSIQELIDQVAREAGGKIEIVKFDRFELGGGEGEE